MIVDIETSDLKIRVLDPDTKNINIFHISESIHYKYIKGDKKPYIENLFRCRLDNGEAAEFGVVRFDNLINKFVRLGETYPNSDENLIKIDNYNIILDGCHRASILFHLGIKKIRVNKL